MSILRLIVLLALGCAMDLAAPVVPVPTGVEFDEDEEVLHLRRAEVGKRPQDGRADRHPDTPLRPRASLSAPIPRRARIDWWVARAGTHRVTPSDRAAPPARSSEDH